MKRIDYSKKGPDSSAGITLEKLMEAKRILDAARVQTRPVFVGTVPQFMRDSGYTRDETLGLIRSGAVLIVRPRRLPVT